MHHSLENGHCLRLVVHSSESVESLEDMLLVYVNITEMVIEIKQMNLFSDS